MESKALMSFKLWKLGTSFTSNLHGMCGMVWYGTSRVNIIPWSFISWFHDSFDTLGFLGGNIPVSTDWLEKVWDKQGGKVGVFTVNLATAHSVLSAWVPGWQRWLSNGSIATFPINLRTWQPCCWCKESKANFRPECVGHQHAMFNLLSLYDGIQMWVNTNVQRSSSMRMSPRHQETRAQTVPGPWLSWSKWRNTAHTLFFSTWELGVWYSDLYKSTERGSTCWSHVNTGSCWSPHPRLTHNGRWDEHNWWNRSIGYSCWSKRKRMDKQLPCVFCSGAGFSNTCLCFCSRTCFPSNTCLRFCSRTFLSNTCLCFCSRACLLSNTCLFVLMGWSSFRYMPVFAQGLVFQIHACVFAQGLVFFQIHAFLCSWAGRLSDTCLCFCSGAWFLKFKPVFFCPRACFSNTCLYFCSRACLLSNTCLCFCSRACLLSKRARLFSNTWLCFCSRACLLSTYLCFCSRACLSNTCVF